MVHALQEAHRVLKSDGILIDLRPAPAHRRVGLGQGRSWEFIGQLHEVLDDDHAADAAVDRVAGLDLFQLEKRWQFRLDRVMDTSEEFRDWLADFDARRRLPPHRALLDQLEQRLARLRKPRKITVRGPMHLQILRKTVGAKMILAILSKPSDVESLLNNLSEADFNLEDVSVIMKDTAMRKKIAKDAGPLKGSSASQLAPSLQKAGLMQDIVQRCKEAVDQGKVLVAMKVDPKFQQAAREMFQDASAEVIQE